MKAVLVKAAYIAIGFALIAPACVWADPPPKAPPTPAQSLADLTARANGGDASAAYDLAQVYVDGIYDQKKNEQTAAQWVAKAAQGGLADAQADYAHRLDIGKGVKPDHAAALSWYVKAADQGQATAVLYVCEAYTQGASADWNKAFSYCKTAADAGAPTALYARGIALAEGRGTTADPVQGLKDLEAAADKGNGDALDALGHIYADGKLVPQNEAQALTWYRKAAMAGSRDGVLHMAQQIENGQGVDADINEAARLYDVLIRGDSNDKARDAISQQALAWFAAHPKIKRDAFGDNILKVNDIARDTIFYAVDNDDPRFQTLDIESYFNYLSQNSYPAAAQNDGISGEAAAECRFTKSGDFDDCVLMRDAPPGHGFGAALMNIFNHLGQSGNKTDWASRYQGKVLRLSMRWKIN